MAGRFFKYPFQFGDTLFESSSRASKYEQIVGAKFAPIRNFNCFSEVLCLLRFILLLWVEPARLSLIAAKHLCTPLPEFECLQNEHTTG